MATPNVNVHVWLAQDSVRLPTFASSFKGDPVKPRRWVTTPDRSPLGFAGSSCRLRKRPTRLVIGLAASGDVPKCLVSLTCEDLPIKGAGSREPTPPREPILEAVGFLVDHPTLDLMPLTQRNSLTHRLSSCDGWNLG